jgi:hypothetical protein
MKGDVRHCNIVGHQPAGGRGPIKPPSQFCDVPLTGRPAGRKQSACEPLAMLGAWQMVKLMIGGAS